jgi:hypothetical protein
MTVADAQTIISVLGLTLLGTAGLLWFLPVGTCSQCSHCKLEKLARQRQHERELEAGRSYVGTFCPVCGRQHRPDEDHRF